MKLAKEYKVQLSATNPSKDLKCEIPIWYHAHAVPAARKLYKTKTARCLRKKHNVKLVRDALSILENIPENHSPAINCICETCSRLHNSQSCLHPFECINTASALLKSIHPRWDPTLNNPQASAQETPEDLEENEQMFYKGNETTNLRDAIKIFGNDTGNDAVPQTNPDNTPAPTSYTSVTGYPLSLPSETLPLLPSSPARSFCDLQVLATSQQILPPFAETPSTPPFHSATSFASPNSRPRGLHTPASCPRLRLCYIFAPTLYPTSLAP